MTLPALLFVDLQNDFLSRDGIVPSTDLIVKNCSRLSAKARESGVLLARAHTQVSVAAGDAMPHWKSGDASPCVAGTHGAQAPHAVSVGPSELVVHKRFYSGFESGELDSQLKDKRVSLLVIAGLYTHACVRATALDAYALGYRVLIVADAIGSPEPLHAEITREYLEKRGFLFVTTEQALSLFTAFQSGVVSDSELERIAAAREHYTQITPLDGRRALTTFTDASVQEIALAFKQLMPAGQSWAGETIEHRTKLLEGWWQNLASQKAFWVEKIVEEVGKTLKDAAEEFERSLKTISVVLETGLSAPESGDAFQVHYRPVGGVLCITPWNNPLAIPIGKIAPALLLGNSVVWKRSPSSTRIAYLLLDSLKVCGLPDGLVHIIPGGANTVRALLREPHITRVTLTGSIAAGKTVESLCAMHGKVLQAELGGNNAAIVFPQADLAATAKILARAVFGYSGQRCTAVRRLIVHEAIASEFIREFVRASQTLVVGDPMLESTDMGPLISRQHADRVIEVIEQAVNSGADLILDGRVATAGPYMAPTILRAMQSDSQVVKEETFGPVAVVQTASNIEQAIQLANGVDQGLVAWFAGGSELDRRVFTQAVQAGMLNLRPTPMAIDVAAPFVGWKASSFGIPEHGRWDKDFYSRVQVTYNDTQSDL